MTLYRGIDLYFTNDVMVLINEKDQVDHQKGLENSKSEARNPKQTGMERWKIGMLEK